MFMLRRLSEPEDADGANIAQITFRPVLCLQQTSGTAQRESAKLNRASLTLRMNAYFAQDLLNAFGLFQSPFSWQSAQRQRHLSVPH